MYLECLQKYDKEEVMRVFYEEGRAAGFAEGFAEAYAEALKEGYAEAFAESLATRRTEGLTKGERRVLALMQKLIASNRTDDIARVASDPEYREKLCEEYGIFWE